MTTVRKAKARLAVRPTVKISANLPQADFELLQDLADRLGINMTDVLRNAIQLEDFIQKVRREEGKVIIKRKDGAMQELLTRP
jgi:hypothetical protein